MPWITTKTKENWRKLLAVFPVILLSISTMACSSASRKAIEIWLVDSEAGVLYRNIGGEEQALPIKGNKDSELFICIDKREMKDTLIHDLRN